ncbi:hypothetical protein BDV12DRAFT_192407 [Aspergillus spectabilis]
MCQVQRVVNACGHTNDHVLMQCHFAKDATPSPESSPTASSFAQAGQGQEQAQTTSSTPLTSPTGAGTGTSSRALTTTPTATYSSSYPPSPTTHTHGGTGEARVLDMIQREGFDARNQPYCIIALPKELKSAKGFKCMVVGCEKAV